jgi:hypothetical protein
LRFDCCEDCLLDVGCLLGGELVVKDLGAGEQELGWDQLEGGTTEPGETGLQDSLGVEMELGFFCCLATT